MTVGVVGLTPALGEKMHCTTEKKMKEIYYLLANTVQ